MKETTIQAMRLSLAIKGQQKARASLTTRGWLSAHINLSQEMEPSSNDRVWLSAHDTSDEPNTISSSWGGFPIILGDKVQIEVLADGEADVPSKVSRTTDNPNNLFSDPAQARQVLDSIKICDLALQEILVRAQGVEPDDEFRKLSNAVGVIAFELDRQLISPTLRRHPDLLRIAQNIKIR